VFTGKNYRGHKYWARLVYLLLGLLISAGILETGCSRPGPFVKIHRLFVGKKWTDEVEGVVPPSKKIEEIRQLGRQMASASSDRRSVIAQQLLAMYQAEEDPNLRWAIFQAFGDGRSPQAYALVELALADPDPDLRVAACRRLGRWGGPEAAERLSRVLSTEKSAAVRIAAIRALGDSRHPHAIAALAAVLEERDPAFQFEAMVALKKLTGQDLGLNAEKWRQYVRSLWAMGEEATLAGREAPSTSR